MPTLAYARSYGAANVLNQVASEGGVPIVFNADANMTSDGVNTYSWTYGNRMVGADRPGGSGAMDRRWTTSRPPPRSRRTALPWRLGSNAVLKGRARPDAGVIPDVGAVAAAVAEAEGVGVGCGPDVPGPCRAGVRSENGSGGAWRTGWDSNPR